MHDVYFPFLYPPDVLVSYLAWQESTLLLALLTDNPHLDVLASLSALHHTHAVAMMEFLPDYRPQSLDAGLLMRNGYDGHFPSSIYLRTK